MRTRPPCRRRTRVEERGIALVMVMGAIAVLAVMLADFQDDASAEHAAAVADRDSVQAEYMARSAINLSRLLIASEPTIRQSIAPLFMFLKRSPPQLPVWEFSDKLLGAFNDAEGNKDFASSTGIDLSLGKNLGLPGGRFEVRIIDEDSKINANLGASNDIAHIRLAKELMGLMAGPQNDPLFQRKSETGEIHDRMKICQGLIDWADTDERAFSCDTVSVNSQSSGVEDSYYQLLKKPYRTKNAPYDSLDELHMVRGVTEDYWATFVDPDPTRPEKRNVTVWGQGSVNVNTANAQTLLGVICAGAPQAEICNDILQASTFLTGVTMARGITMGAPLFGNTGDFLATLKGQGMLGPLLAAIGMKPVKFQSEAEFAKSVTTESKMFSIYAVGVVKGYKRETRTRIHAVVDFRSAPNPLQTAVAAIAGATTAGTTTGGATSSSSTTDAFTSVLKPSTGGILVYFRVE